MIDIDITQLKIQLPKHILGTKEHTRYIENWFSKNSIQCPESYYVFRHVYIPVINLDFMFEHLMINN